MGEVLARSNACLRFVGSLVDMYPDNLLERARIDGILDSNEDVLNAFRTKWFLEPDAEAKVAGATELAEEIYPYWLSKFEQRLEKNEKLGSSSGLFVGDKISIADLKCFGSFRVMAMVPGVAQLLRQYERVTKFSEVMKSQGGVQAALDKYQANYDAFNADNEKNLFKHPGKGIHVFQSKYASGKSG